MRFRQTKDEPQANDSYKIRQIIIKGIDTYTHTPMSKVKTVQEIKYSRLTWKTNQKLYLPIKNKTN